MVGSAVATTVWSRAAANMATRSAMKIAATARLDSDVELASSVSATRVSLGHPSLELGRIIGGHPMHDLEVDCVHSPGHLEG